MLFYICRHLCIIQAKQLVLIAFDFLVENIFHFFEHLFLIESYFVKVLTGGEDDNDEFFEKRLGDLVRGGVVKGQRFFSGLV